MIDYLAWLSLFLVRQDNDERKHPQYKRLFQREEVYVMESQLTEIVALATESIALQTEAREKNVGTFATQAIMSAELISNSKNITSSPKVTLVATIASTPTYQALPSMYHHALPNKLRSSLIASSYATRIQHSNNETPTPVISSQILSQSQNILALTSLHNGPSEFPSLNYNRNFTSLISSPNIASGHVNSLSIVISTSSKLSFASLIAITSSTSTSSFDRGIKATASSLSSLPTESVTPSQTMLTPTSTITTKVENTQSSSALSIASPTKVSSHHFSHHAPYTPVVVGSVMGSIAGVAMLVFFIMLLLRWQKSNKWMVSSDNEAISGVPRGAPRQKLSGDISLQKPHNFSMPAALASFTVTKLMSQKKCRLSSSTNPDEKAFYRISGRKLPSVFQHGGDGYGEGAPAPSINNASSCDNNLQGLFSVSGYASRSSLALSPSGGINRVIHPNLPLDSLTEPDLLQPPILKPPQLPDSIGRSRPSMDSSLTSRFTEEV
ncbi:hypothetical protein OnM2_025020 [Erysiphe neolycopersici]|uniref:Uncharacterized protein n=1 Tax=Erysiphe neolycopersici TaxID=212602 RepID=A0A420I172_9PEZI|nr:hypothetical protein OnM2_025020 [Erysiphe neolycopersici]